MLDKPQWGNPSNFFLSFRCTISEYAEAFVNRGEIKFNTPQSWVDYGKIYGKGRGDIYEGTVAYFHILDIERMLELTQKYKVSDGVFPMNSEQFVYLKRHRTMQLPTFCFFSLKNSLFECPSDVGKQKVSTEINSTYFRDFAENMTPAEVDSLPENKKPAIVFIRDFDEFKSRLTNKLCGLGLDKSEIIIGHVNYYDFKQHGKTGWTDFGQKQPYELYVKDVDYSHQSEARIVINTDKQKIKDLLLKEPIQIGDLSDIVEFITTYLHDGMRIEANVTVSKEKDLIKYEPNKKLHFSDSFDAR